jgi:hypothetical protein
MKRTSIVVAIVVVGALGFAAGLYVRAQSPPVDPFEQRVIRQTLIASGEGDRYVGAKNLTEDVKMLLFESDRGGYQARLLVRVGDRWMPVAVSGLGDGNIPLPAH